MMPSKRFILVTLSILALGMIAVGIRYTQTKSNEPRSLLSILQTPNQFLEPDSEVVPGGTDFIQKNPDTTVDEPDSIKQQPNGDDDQTETVADRPQIDRISKTVFGNGDQITIYGKNFTKSNTIFLSIDFKNAFSRIPSFDGTTLTFTAKLSLTKRIFNEIKYLPPLQMRKVLDQMIKNASKDSLYKDGWYLPATITVINENGTSAKKSVLVNVTKGI